MVKPGVAWGKSSQVSHAVYRRSSANFPLASRRVRQSSDHTISSMGSLACYHGEQYCHPTTIGKTEMPALHYRLLCIRFTAYYAFIYTVLHYYLLLATETSARTKLFIYILIYLNQCKFFLNPICHQTFKTTSDDLNFMSPFGPVDTTDGFRISFTGVISACEKSSCWSRALASLGAWNGWIRMGFCLDTMDTPRNMNGKSFLELVIVIGNYPNTHIWLEQKKQEKHIFLGKVETRFFV